CLAHAKPQSSVIEAADQLVNGIDLAPAFSVGFGERRGSHLPVEELVEAGLGASRRERLA
ncbi:MAG: hypothetical protein JW940_02385, partial [Polyangiaceae bacterium]|nr:hypothetical protein [Polyangiaceae bacterium]